MILASRDADRAERAAAQIRSAGSVAQMRVVHLDLASLASIRAAAEEIGSYCPRLDLLINNARVMGVPCQRTEDGFELTFAVNHRGHLP